MHPNTLAFIQVSAFACLVVLAYLWMRVVRMASPTMHIAGALSIASAVVMLIFLITPSTMAFWCLQVGTLVSIWLVLRVKTTEDVARAAEPVEIPVEGGLQWPELPPVFEQNKG